MTCQYNVPCLETSIVHLFSRSEEGKSIKLYRSNITSLSTLHNLMATKSNMLHLSMPAVGLRPVAGDQSGHRPRVLRARPRGDDAKTLLGPGQVLHGDDVHRAEVPLPAEPPGENHQDAVHATRVVHHRYCEEKGGRGE